MSSTAPSSSGPTAGAGAGIGRRAGAPAIAGTARRLGRDLDRDRLRRRLAAAQLVDQAAQHLDLVGRVLKTTPLLGRHAKAVERVVDLARLGAREAELAHDVAILVAHALQLAAGADAELGGQIGAAHQHQDEQRERADRDRDAVAELGQAVGHVFRRRGRRRGVENDQQGMAEIRHDRAKPLNTGQSLARKPLIKVNGRQRCTRPGCVGPTPFHAPSRRRRRGEPSGPCVVVSLVGDRQGVESMRKLLTAGVLAGALLGAGLAGPAGAAGEEQTYQGVRYLCTGVGEERDAPGLAAYSAKIMLTTKNGAYVANADITIDDAKGKRVLETTCHAPWLLADLKPGRYQVLGQGRPLSAPGHHRRAGQGPGSGDLALLGNRRLNRLSGDRRRRRPRRGGSRRRGAVRSRSRLMRPTRPGPSIDQGGIELHQRGAGADRADKRLRPRRCRRRRRAGCGPRSGDTSRRACRARAAPRAGRSSRPPRRDGGF